MRHLDVDPGGQLIVADQDASRVLKIDPISREVLGIIGTGLPSKGPNQLDDPDFGLSIPFIFQVLATWELLLHRYAKLGRKPAIRATTAESHLVRVTLPSRLCSSFSAKVVAKF